MAAFGVSAVVSHPAPAVMVVAPIVPLIVVFEPKVPVTVTGDVVKLEVTGIVKAPFWIGPVVEIVSHAEQLLVTLKYRVIWTTELPMTLKMTWRPSLVVPAQYPS
jgi:hypothetical protein